MYSRTKDQCIVLIPIITCNDSIYSVHIRAVMTASILKKSYLMGGGVLQPFMSRRFDRIQYNGTL